MNANDNQYGSLTPNPEEEEEKKKKKSSIKKKALVGLAALLVAGGCSAGIGSCIANRQAPPMPEETAVVVVDKRETAPTPTEYIVPVAPTPVPTQAVPVESDDDWYGYYDGTATGTHHGQNQVQGSGTWEFENQDLWLHIVAEEDCGTRSFYPICVEERPWAYSEDRPWALDVGPVVSSGHPLQIVIKLYLPEELSDAEGVTVTEDRLVIEPSEEHPYELVLERKDGHLEGYLLVGEVTQGEGVRTQTSKWVIDNLVADETTDDNPWQQ